MKILFIDIDTLRPDHLGCYGYERNTSPNIDSIAKDSVVFNQYYCSDAPCLPSRTALMTGKFGIHTRVVGHGGTTADIRPEGPDRGFKAQLNHYCLPGMLKEQGFKTVTISPFAERHSSWVFYAGFNEVYNTGKGGQEVADEVTPIVLDWLERNKDQENWFLHVNYWDPHTPYRTPMELGDDFKDDPMPAWLTKEVFEQHKKAVGAHTTHELGMYVAKTNPNRPRDMAQLNTYEDAKTFIDNYDMGIKYADYNVGRILNKLKEMGIYEDMMIIVSSDHGESMGEFGIYGEHGMADYATMRIPMIIKCPMGLHGITDQGLHYNLDLAPTLAELFGAEKKPQWDGQSYAKSLLTGEDTGRPELILGQCAHVCERAVRFDNWHYIRVYHDGFRLLDKEMLFDIENDPHMTRDLKQEKPEIVHEAVYKLTNWHDDMMLSMDTDVDPLWTVIKEGGPQHAKGHHLVKYLERLEETGRHEAAELLREKHQRFLK